ncbi:putative peptidase [Kibdelosporangium banguiense]|uniref:Peptidase n=1 Tax=Kibdelosporangium banguiense TaxID=1365924 RepID=A0ABS4TYB9_9PSEU|nr:hypothetical protein [Kibdelosporangium banguiense]MBP2329361.1 putative peptidase [Kibdelosporangium banguiense]
MALLINRRTVLAAGAGAAAAGLALPGVATADSDRTNSVGFVLNAVTLDGGEQVTAVTLDTSRLGPIDPASLTAGTFSVHATATSPIATGGQVVGYDLDRTVTAAQLDRRGNIVLSLSHAEGQPGGGTLGYIGSKARNVQLDLVYTITQNAPIVLRHGRPVTIARFVQGRLANPEVDAFSYHVSGSGMKYRLYTPTRHGRRPLVVWLHGEARVPRCRMTTTTTKPRCAPIAARWVSLPVRHSRSSTAPMSWSRRALPCGCRTVLASPR